MSTRVEPVVVEAAELEFSQVHGELSEIWATGLA